VSRIYKVRRNIAQFVQNRILIRILGSPTDSSGVKSGDFDRHGEGAAYNLMFSSALDRIPGRRFLPSNCEGRGWDGHADICASRTLRNKPGASVSSTIWHSGCDRKWGPARKAQNTVLLRSIFQNGCPSFGQESFPLQHCWPGRPGTPSALTKTLRRTQERN